MTNSKKAKRFQFWINVVLILITLSIVLPFVLVFISSLTDENTLIRNGYSFFPEKFSFYAYSYIIRQGEKILRAYGITVFVTIVGTAANIAMSATGISLIQTERNNQLFCVPSCCLNRGDFNWRMTRKTP